jgi:hypothetical protein
MKRILPLLAGLLVLAAGCKTVTKEDVCATAQSAYTIYLAIINADGKPSNDQILAAQAAAAILTQQCGWTNPKRNLLAFDQNGVQKIIPPK